MLQQIYDEQDLPLSDMEAIGLAKNGRVFLTETDLASLLSGRRTGMTRLENLSSEGIQIPALDAKLSLKPNKKGALELLLHPIYKEAEIPEYLTESEAEKLEKGEAVNIEKEIVDGKGMLRNVLIEFDPDTREFIITDTAKILTPEMVNDEALTSAQKERYRKGKEVELPDGTTIRFSGTDEHAVRSNKLALIASLIIDGGLSYVLFKGLNALFGKERDLKEAANLSPGYYLAETDMEEQQNAAGQQQNAGAGSLKDKGYNLAGFRR